MSILRPHVSQRTTLAVTRILIASYFAACIGLIDHAATAAFLDRLMDSSLAKPLVVIVLYGTAFAIMIGRMVRAAALILASFFFWASFVHTFQGLDPAALARFWTDIALVGALLLIAILEPGGSRAVRLRKVLPRRLAARRAITPRPVAAVARVLRPVPDETEDANIFADIRDRLRAA